MVSEEHHPFLKWVSGRSRFNFDVCLTMLEIELDVVASDVRGHGDDRGAIKLANEMACRYTVQIRHNDIHQN